MDAAEIQTKRMRSLHNIDELRALIRDGDEPAVEKARGVMLNVVVIADASMLDAMLQVLDMLVVNMGDNQKE